MKPCMCVRKLGFSSCCHLKPPAVLQRDLIETFSFCLLKSGSTQDMGQLEFDSEALSPLEGCRWPLAGALRSSVIEGPAPSNDELKFRAGPNLEQTHQERWHEPQVIVARRLTHPTLFKPDCYPVRGAWVITLVL